MALHTQNVVVIATANSSHVATSLSATVRFCRHGRWLGKGNRYSSETIERLARDIKAAAVNPRHLAQYIAVSALLHVTDGWSYLGRSMQSLLQGDPNRALHLGYYAELRAAMSLLATEGIGVFKNKHFVVDGDNHASRLQKKSPTHEFAWDALNYWAQSPTSGALFADVVRPYGRPLEGWLAPFGGGAAVLPQAQAWFKQWGMDLTLIGEDRESRNSRSYRPSGLPAPWLVQAEDVMRFVTELWALLEPSVSSFELLDRHVLRLSIESLFKGRTGIDPAPDVPQFSSLVDSVLANQALTAALSSEWRKFLLRQSYPSDPGVVLHSKIFPQESATDAYGVASRAALLLRMATGATHRLFESAGVPDDSIDFWRSELGVSRGFWDPGAEPKTMTDLWSDIVDATADAEPFFKQLAPQDRTFRHLALQFGQSVVPFGGCERVALWGVMSAP